MLTVTSKWCLPQIIEHHQHRHRDWWGHCPLVYTYNITYYCLNEFLKCITKSVKGAAEPQCAKKWRYEEMSFKKCKRRTDNTYSLCGETCWGHKVQTLHLLYVTASLWLRERKSFDHLIIMDPQFLSTYHFKRDMWLFAFSPITCNNRREWLDKGITHRPEWESWPCLLMIGHWFYVTRFWEITQMQCEGNG